MIAFTKNEAINLWLEQEGYNKETFKELVNPCGIIDYRLIPNQKEAVELIREAVDNNKHIRIMGDYDADGIFATSELTLAIKRIGGNVDFDIPNRLKDGYGMNNAMIDRAHDDKVDLIITCDNGIVCEEQINRAKDYGMKIIVTDHHNFEKLPERADVIVHPALGYPFREISGAETAWKLSLCLLEAYNIEDEDLEDYMLQMAGITIISDVMPLGSTILSEARHNENRSILKETLDALRFHPNWHFLMIQQHMKYLDLQKIDETTLSFSIIPMINAIGRLDDATHAVNMFTSSDRKEVELELSYAIYLNECRKEMTANGFEKANHEVDFSKPVIIWVDGAHKGIVGIIAGKLEDETGKPTIVFSREIEEDGTSVLHGSARSNTVNIYNMLQATDCLEAFGGHAGAAGLTLKESNLEKFKEEVFKYAEEHPAENTKPLPIECAVQDLDGIADVLKELKPFGNGNASPMFQFNNLKLYGVDKFYRSGMIEFNCDGHISFRRFRAVEEYDKNHMFDDMMYKSYDNTEKRMLGNPDTGTKGMSREEAESGRMEKWKAKMPAPVINCQVTVDINNEYDSTNPYSNELSFNYIDGTV